MRPEGDPGDGGRAHAAALGGSRRGRAEPEDFVTTATATIAACVAEAGTDAGAVAGIGITGQMAGTMGIDAQWRPSTPYDSWLDLRCAEDVEALDRAAGNDLVRLAGLPADGQPRAEDPLAAA